MTQAKYHITVASASILSDRVPIGKPNDTSPNPTTSPEPRPKPEAAVRAFTRLLRASASTTRLLSAELLEEHGLTINDYEALLVLSHADGQRLKRVDISRQLLLTPSGITRLLEGLEAEGLVERESCPPTSASPTRA